MEQIGEQAELFGLVWRPLQFPFRLRVNDVIRIDGRLGLVIRVTECAAVVVMNRRTREFITRFDKQVRFELLPVMVRISANSESEVLNRKFRKQTKHRQPRKEVE